MRLRVTRSRRNVLALTASVLLLTSACSSSTSSTSTSPSASQKPLTIGFVTHVVGNPFIQQIIDAAQQAANDLGVTLKVAGPSGAEADAQLTAAQNLVAAGINGLAISVPSASMVTGLNKIIAGGIPVVTFNLLQKDVLAPYVGEKSVQSGRLLGSKVVELLGGVSKAKGSVVLGNCFPGFPVLENRAKGVKASLAKAAGIKVVGPFDVKVDAAENFAKWQGLLAANPKAAALVGLCAPDIASIGKVAAGAPSAKFIGGGYDLTSDNLAAIEAGHAQVSLGQTPFMQGYLPVYMLVDSIRKGVKLTQGFIDAGTEIVTKDSVTEPYGLPALTFADLMKMATSKDETRKYYQPLVDGVIKDWQKNLKPISVESE
jgi:ABC-type sugar transport system substrate-binding protein